MRKLHLLKYALFAMFAFAACTAASASAAPEWLVGGASIPQNVELLVEAGGIMILLDLGTPAGEVEIECSNILDGVIKAKGEDLITEVLNLEGNRKVELGKELLCVAARGCEKPMAGEDTFVAPEKLPWLSQLTLDTPNGENLYLDLISAATNGQPAWNVDCLIAGLLFESTCEGETSAFLTLFGTSLLYTFNVPEQEAEKLETVCGGVANEGAISAQGTIKDAEGEELDVSG